MASVAEQTVVIHNGDHSRLDLDAKLPANHVDAASDQLRIKCAGVYLITIYGNINVKFGADGDPAPDNIDLTFTIVADGHCIPETSTTITVTDDQDISFERSVLVCLKGGTNLSAYYDVDFYDDTGAEQANGSAARLTILDNGMNVQVQRVGACS